MMQKDDHYFLCNDDAIETIQHAFWDYPHITTAWVKYNQLCTAALLLPLNI